MNLDLRIKKRRVTTIRHTHTHKRKERQTRLIISLHNTKNTMSSPSSGSRQMLRPANVVYKFIQDAQRVRIWLVYDTKICVEGVLVGYDSFMNVVLSDASEVNLKEKTSTHFGKMLLRSDNVGVIHPIGV